MKSDNAREAIENNDLEQIFRYTVQQFEEMPSIKICTGLGIVVPRNNCQDLSRAYVIGLYTSEDCDGIFVSAVSSEVLDPCCLCGRRADSLSPSDLRPQFQPPHDCRVLRRAIEVGLYWRDSVDEMFIWAVPHDVVDPCPLCGRRGPSSLSPSI